ncbi:MAG: hypothetical protein EPN97_01895 [Alphaproteobacteria bacterium]|nr:MAG: hypothetical protein EPN97_01895 [Alphaproteobacteria bacterium]
MDTGAVSEMLHNSLSQYYISAMLVMAPAVRIFMRAGFKPWPALLLLIPYVGPIFAAAYLAFIKWPRTKEMKS